MTSSNDEKTQKNDTTIGRENSDRRRREKGPQGQEKDTGTIVYPFWKKSAVIHWNVKSLSALSPLWLLFAGYVRLSTTRSIVNDRLSTDKKGPLEKHYLEGLSKGQTYVIRNWQLPEWGTLELTASVAPFLHRRSLANLIFSLFTLWE